MLTDTDAVTAQCFAEKAVELPHVAHSGPRPAVGRDTRLNLFPKSCNELGLLCEVVQCVCEGLKTPGGFKLGMTTQSEGYSTHVGCGVDTHKVEHE